MSADNPLSSSAAADQTKVRVPFFRSKKTLSDSIRRRNPDEDEERKNRILEKEDCSKSDSSEIEDEDSDLSNPTKPMEEIRLNLVEKRKRLRGRSLIQTTDKRRRKELDDLMESSGDDEEQSPKFDPDVKFSSSGVERVGPNDMGATARTEVDTEYGRDAQSQFERVQQILKKEREEMEKKLAIEEEERKKYGEKAKKARDTGEAGTSKPKIYRGMALYGAKEKEDTIKGNASSGLNRLGPIRATQYMRASVRWDYAPDICKDYKETGFCTFGDSCKFMHDRTDYKHGWEIEKDWQEGKLKEAKEDEYLVSSEEDGDSDDDKLPHSCYICREHFKQPVVTKCKHYFCESCALKNYQKSKKCAVCGEKTDGIFNVARDILAKMQSRDKLESQQNDSDIDEEPSASAAEQIEVKTLPIAEEGSD